MVDVLAAPTAHVRLTPIQIALLAMAFETYERHPPPSANVRDPDDRVAVWGSWRAAAVQLRRAHKPGLLQDLGTERGSREMEWRNLRGRHRRGKEGRLVHLYRLERRAVDLAARCAWAVKHLPKGRTFARWQDVPEAVPAEHGRRCPRCFCTPGDPCRIFLVGDGEGRCVPAGVVGLEACSACLP